MALPCTFPFRFRSFREVDKTDTKQIEGMFTIVVGVIFISLFPKQVGNPVSTFGVKYFNEREIYILARRTILDDPSKVHAKPHVSWAELKRTVSCLLTGLKFTRHDAAY